MSFVLEGVTYAYRRGEPAVLRDLTLTLPSGTTTAIMGASGTGKSTLLSLLGLLWEGQLQNGSICFRTPAADYPYDRLTNAGRARLRREAFGFVPQNCYLLPGFTCAQNVMMPLLLHGTSPRECRRRLDEQLARDSFASLRGVLHKFGGEVAGGERQRLAVLRAVLHAPQVVFADEPVSNLDLVNTQTFLDLLRRWRKEGEGDNGSGKGRTLLLVCHDPETAWEMAGDDGQFLFLYPRPPHSGGDAPPTAYRLLSPPDLPRGPEDLRRCQTSPPEPAGLAEKVAP